MQADRRFDAYQDLILAFKMFWTREIYPALAEEYAQRVALRERQGGQAPAHADDVFALFDDSTLYQYFAWLERHLQRFKYSGRHGLVPHHEVHREELLRALARDFPDGLLQLDPDLELPRYYTSVDIHQHPGGVGGDELAGIIYERGARSTTPLLEKDKDLHYLFARLVTQRKQPKRLFDMGCGFGKSTRPFYTELRHTQVVGMDLSAPCLRLAAMNAADDQARDLSYLQGDVTASGLDDASFDVVTSTMLLHEMPPPVIERLVTESYRLLEDGGVAIHLDFLPPNDPFKKFVHYGHSRRNNEPFMRPLDEMGIADTHYRTGFTQVEILPFAEMPGALDPSMCAWRFPCAVIVAEKKASENVMRG